MATYIKNVQVTGLYDRFNIEQDFYPGINILFGVNGGCKTTFLHILANALNGDFDRFAFLTFKEIKIELDDGKTLSLDRKTERSEFGGSRDYIVSVKLDESNILDRISVNEIEIFEDSLSLSSGGDFSKIINFSKPTKFFPTFYLPAFRSVIDAWKSSQRKQHNSQDKDTINAQATLFVRRWLLPFIPWINYPSLKEIEMSLKQSTYAENYLLSLNSFLDRKKIVIFEDLNKSEETIVELVYEDGSRSIGLSALSSGERQIAILLFVTNQTEAEKVILVDEPEISLHVDWQRLLINEIAKQNKDKQIIACTHSPVIGADEEHRMELTLKPFRAKDNL